MRKLIISLTITFAIMTVFCMVMSLALSNEKFMWAGLIFLLLEYTFIYLMFKLKIIKKTFIN